MEINNVVELQFGQFRDYLSRASLNGMDAVNERAHAFNDRGIALFCYKVQFAIAVNCIV
jgi:hypothetical protein